MPLTLPITKALLVMLPLTALVAVRHDAGPSVPAPVLQTELNPKKCEDFAIPVWCYRFGGNHSNIFYYNCFDTLCEAVAAGYSQCTTQSHNIPCDSGVAMSERQ